VGTAGNGGGAGSAGSAGAGGAGGVSGAGGRAGGAAGGGGSALPPSCTRAGNRALHYGGGHWVTIQDSATQHPADLTVELWVAFGSPIGIGYHGEGIVTKGNGTWTSYTIYHTNGELHAGVAGTKDDSSYMKVAFAPVLGRWYHFALTYDHVTSKQKLYVDGELLVSGDAPGPLTYDAHPLYVGASINAGNNGPAYPFGGDIDELTVWPTARTAEQIKGDIAACQPASVADRAGHWTFDDPSGQVVTDSSPNANHGFLGAQSSSDASDPTSIYSTVPFGGDFTLPAAGVSPTSACGKPRNKALHFGDGHYAEVADAPSLHPEDFTFEAWVRFDTTIYEYHGCGYGLGQVIAIKATYNKATSFSLYYNDPYGDCGADFNGFLRAEGTTGRISYQWLPVLGRWYHIAFSYDHAATNSLKLYVDDNLVGSAPGTVTYDASPLRIGSNIPIPSFGSTPVSSFLGDIDEVKLWSTARDLDKITADMKTCTPASLDGLAAYWSFDDGTGAVAADATTNHTNLQLGATVNADANDPSWIVSTVPF